MGGSPQKSATDLAFEDLNSTFQALREGLDGDIVVASVDAVSSLVVDPSVLDDSSNLACILPTQRSSS